MRQGVLSMRSRCALVAILTITALALAGPVAAQTGRVSGIVRDEGGRPIKGATVTAENPQAVPSTFTATSDEDGRFSMLGLRAGQWVFTAQAPGFVPTQGRAQIRTIATNPPIEFTLAKGANAPGGSALAGVDVKAIQAELEKADALFNAGAYDEAIAAYKAVMAKAPALTNIHLPIGRAYRQQGKYDEALAAYEEILRADPTNERAMVEIGETHLLRGNLDAAENVLAAAAERPGASREVFYLIAEVKFVRGQSDEAASWYQRAVDTDPKWVKPLFKLALVALNKGDNPKAAEYLERVVEADPESAEAAQARTVLQQIK